MLHQGYWFIRNLTVEQLAALAERVPDGPSTRRLVELGAAAQITIGAGLVRPRGDGMFHNTYVVALPDGTTHRHRKLHAFEHTSIRMRLDYTVFDLLPMAARRRVDLLRLHISSRTFRITALRELKSAGTHQTARSEQEPHPEWLDRPALVGQSPRRRPEASRRIPRRKGRGWLMRWLRAARNDNGCSSFSATASVWTTTNRWNA